MNTSIVSNCCVDEEDCQGNFSTVVALDVGGCFVGASVVDGSFVGAAVVGSSFVDVLNH